MQDCCLQEEVLPMASARPSWSAQKHRWSEEDPKQLSFPPSLDCWDGGDAASATPTHMLLQESREADGIWLSWLAGS